VDFTYPKPSDLSAHEVTFACKELHFNRPVSGIYYSAETLDYPMIRAGEDLHEEVVIAMQKIFDTQGTGAPFLRSVRDIIARSLPKGSAEISEVAARLNLSSRTLQRRLKENGTSFSQVLQGVRKSMAIYYLQHKHLNITQTAFILGYSSPEAFTKAFKLWCGKTPQSFLRE
jgi:AraC-like DNA-binding protein